MTPLRAPPGPRRPSRRPAVPPRRGRTAWVVAVVLVALAAAALERCRMPDPAGRPTWTVRVVHDGDTVTCHDTDGRPHRIRLVGIDAPELEQAHGRVARGALARKLAERRVAVASRGFDKHGRLLATLWIDDRDINLEMVEEGHAWVFGGFAPDPELVAAESRARGARLGLWEDGRAEEPAAWRAAHPREP